MTSNGSLRRSLLSTFLVVLFAAAAYHLDVVGRVAYAVERGRIRADQEELAQLSSQDVAQLENLSHAFSLVAATVKPSVVNINTLKQVAADDNPAHRELRRLFGRPGGTSLQSGTGSGVVMDDAGHIVTNNHVVGDADRVDVTLADGRKFKAKVIGTDRMTDLAVIKIDAARLHAAKFGDSDRCTVGDLVLAIGSPFRLALTVSHGIISARGRNVETLDIEYQDFIQTDAPINPGNSGGPLVNARGEVVGINTAIATESGGYQGVGFSIPANKVKQIASMLIAGKGVARGYLGVTIGDIDDAIASAMGLETIAGAQIQDVVADGPAARGGVKAGDVVLEVNGRKVQDRSSLSEIIAAVEPHQVARLTVQRGHARRELTVRIGEQPRNFSTRPSRNLPLNLRGLPPAERDDSEEIEPQPAEREPAKRPRSPHDDSVRGPSAFDELGITVTSLDKKLAEDYQLADVQKGVLVTELDPIGDAYGSLVMGDVIVRVDDRPVATVGELRKALSDEALRHGVRLVVKSRGGTRYVGLRSR